MLKIAISEGAIADLSWAEPAAKALGLEIHVVSIATPEDVAKNLVGMDALVVSLQKVNAEVIAALPDSVKCVGRLGVGLDNIDLEAAKSSKLPVIFQPTYAYNEVANHAISMIMALHRGLMTASNGIKNSEWIPAPKVAEIISLQDSTLGVVGCGRIGQSLIEKMKPLVKEIVGFDPAITTPIPGVRMVKTLDELIECSQIITLHAPYMPSTHHMFGKEQLAKMQKGSILVNVSRGGLIDENALCDALNSGHLDGAGLDVFEKEPLQADSPLRSAKNIILTPHIAWYSQSAGRRLVTWALTDVHTFLTGKDSLNGKFAAGPFN